jgi:hypothetical protein
VGQRGWNADEFEEWLYGALCSELLGRRPRRKRVK